MLCSFQALCRDERGPRTCCYPDNLVLVLFREAFYASPFLYPAVCVSYFVRQSKLAILVTSPHKDPPIRRENDDVVVAEGHVLHVGLDTEVNGDRHVGEILEERSLPGPTAPAVEVAPFGQSREGVAASGDLDYRACW